MEEWEKERKRESEKGGRERILTGTREKGVD